MSLELVAMTHPKLPGQTARVPVQAVPHHQRAGWSLAGPDPPPDPPEDQVTTDEAPAPAGASALPDKPRRRTRGDE